jgi:hypothetical protein
VVEKMANLVIGSLNNKDLRDDGHQNRPQKVLAHLQQKGQSSKEQAEGCREIAVIADIARDRREEERQSLPNPHH